MSTTQRRTISVVPYDPGWVRLFEREAEQIKRIMGDNLVAIHHIGSTSVPFLAAKPIIDIMPEVKDVNALDTFDHAMEQLGYVVKGEFGIPGRRFYLKGPVNRTHHVHAFETGSKGLVRHLAVRDYLRTFPKEASAYAQLKIKLAEQFPYDNDGYCEGKHEFVQSLEQRALIWRENRQEESEA